METKKVESCGFGKKRKSYFGNTLDSFYKEGSTSNTFLTPEIKKCLNIIYSNEDATYNGFGKKRKSGKSGKKVKSVNLSKINKYINYIKSLK
jgi:hypothetical protein